jgi:hypothetical protein
MPLVRDPVTLMSLVNAAATGCCSILTVTVEELVFAPPLSFEVLPLLARTLLLFHAKDK